ncbi:hypothetical protein ACSBR2_035239 [Camellia fascicularis]
MLLSLFRWVRYLPYNLVMTMIIIFIYFFFWDQGGDDDVHLWHPQLSLRMFGGNQHLVSYGTPLSVQALYPHGGLYGPSNMTLGAAVENINTETKGKAK